MRAISSVVFRLAILIFACFCFNANARPQLPTEMQQKIDKVATDALTKTGVPSASIAVVKDGQVAYLHAYGNARLDPSVPAKPGMRYSIGSISKQFTAAAILLLQEQRKLSLDDKVGKFIPGLTRGKEVTIRQILSHTSGYQDYWPQDYVMPMMLQPTTPQRILDDWAHKPLDFEPETKWQYSNTNYVIAGLIVEKASGEPLLHFLREKIFTPLSMTDVADTDQKKLDDADPEGYLRYALGPPRSAPKEGRGWLFAAGELAMPAENEVFPDERVAVIVLTNQDAANAAQTIARGISPLLLVSDDPATPEKLVQARKILKGLQHGEIDRSLFTSNANFYFNEQALQDFASSLGPLGDPEEFVEVGHNSRGGMVERVYRIKFPKAELRAWTYEMPDGKLEQYQVAAQE